MSSGFSKVASIEGQKPKVSILILNWNGLEDTVECLESLRRITYPNYEIVIVDNASTGPDVEVLRQEYGDSIHIIQNEKNLGFSNGFFVGVNYALERGTAYVLLLHNDTRVAPDFLEGLVQASERDNRIGIAFPRLYRYEQPEEIEYGGERAGWLGFRSIKAQPKGREEAIECVIVLAICALFRVDKLERMELQKVLGEYFLYEDPMWSLAALKAGLKLVQVRGSKVWHKRSRSLRKAGPTRLRWLVRDRLIIRYRLLTGGYWRSLAPTHFIYWFLQLMVYRLPVEMAFLMRNLRWDVFAALWQGLKEGIRHILARDKGEDQLGTRQPEKSS